MWAPWMVFLVFPFIAAFEADVATPQRVWAVAVTVAFGAVYAVTTHRLSSGPLPTGSGASPRPTSRSLFLSC